MRCPGCHQDNPDSARFCNGCGTRLTAAATAVEPQTYTPAHIADKIRTSRAAMVGERKQVTVLFADLKGSMELLGDRDPEEARRLLDAVLERMMEAVHRYEGTVNQVMGDGIMALFGAPLAHEDHAVRACYAALRMQETVGRYAELIQKTEGISVRIRVGLNSGEVDSVGRALASLQTAGFLYEASLFPDVVYRFKSALTRDVAYASLLREQRRVLHGRIVEAIERLDHDRRTSHVDQLAFHASRGEVWAKALDYNRQVGARAVLHAANGEAVQAFQDALAALKRLPETRETLEQAIDLRLDLRPPLLQLGRLDDVLAVSREAEKLAADLGDEPRLARVYTYLINYHYLKGETTHAIEYGQRCLDVGRAIGDPALQGLARQYMGQSYHAQGDYARAERALRENIEATAGDQATSRTSPRAAGSRSASLTAARSTRPTRIWPRRSAPPRPPSTPTVGSSPGP